LVAKALISLEGISRTCKLTLKKLNSDSVKKEYILNYESKYNFHKLQEIEKKHAEVSTTHYIYYID
jgi:hypothetical protein